MSAPAPSTRGLLFWLGIGLMVVSFALYPAYGLIALLPISRWAKTASYAAGWGLSWSLFFAGSLLAGKEGVEIVRAQIARRRALLRARFWTRQALPSDAPLPPGPLPKGDREQTKPLPPQGDI